MHSRKPRTCDCVGCTNHTVALGLCSTCYGRHRKHLPLQRRGESVPRTNEPWQWLGDENTLAEMTAAQEKHK